MSESPNPTMLEATRLTRAGRVGEATALLRQTLGIASPDIAAKRGSSRVPETAHNWFGRAAPFMRGTAAPVTPPEPDNGGLGAGQFLARTYEGAAGTLRYRLYVPSGYQGEPVPLVIMLHGCKQSPEDFAAGTRMNAYAEEGAFLAAYPEQPASANVSRCWNWFRPEHQRRGAGEAALLASVTEQVMGEQAVDRSRVYIAGLSAGGAAAAIMASAYPDLYAAVGVHSGLACGAAHDLPSAFGAMRHGIRRDVPRQQRQLVPTIVFHADDDRTVNPQNSEHIVEQAAADMQLQKTVETGQAPGGRAYSRTCYVDRSGTVVLEAWTIHGGGHAWAGGSSGGSYTDPRGPDATREMTRFFLAHRLRE